MTGYSSIDKPKPQGLDTVREETGEQHDHLSKRMSRALGISE